MSEEVTYQVNDTTRSIRAVSQTLRRFESEIADPRIKAMILTKLQEAELLSLLLINE
jgi:hypothetical protein